ncbi:unnamed protein product [Paramecium primaurelia]|uniref:4Fe-4S ferredoxin-type domain-containing protein n=1 Tax=Paramecium primaurelia TaxID=5886 RepID=A0A8S1MEX2_PARPR|nr:unnamed protein product [Paramecium primaurelia]
MFLLTTIDGCLTCDISLNRILIGLQCQCISGYYELNNICINCPNIEDISLNKCYKLCNNNQYIWHTIICNSCDNGFQLISGECQPICGDQLIIGYEQCEDNNNILDDLCYNCQYQCPIHCLTCDQDTILPCPDICGDGYITGIEECEDGNNIQYDGCYNCKYQCQPQCTQCIKGQCFQCATAGWFIDPTITPWQCKERCGDMQIVGTEQCEDGNSSDTDGCKDCKYQCRIGCSSCDYNTKTCLSCEFTGFVPQSYYCKNICGDGLVVSDPYGFYSEQCDDGNTINYDGCSSSCQFQCQQSSICTSCINNKCEICAPGYYLSFNQICIPKCGDSIKVAVEKCEDSFVLPYKGCQNCIPKCQSSCLNCDNSGLGCLQCKSGYDRIDNLCYSICGDRIITDDEQCDDANFIIDDGCHLCQFTCQHSCLNCIQGLCYNCQDGYQLQSFKCYPICGDGIYQNDEQCEILDQQLIEKCVNCGEECGKYCQICYFGKCQLCQVGFYMTPNTYICQIEYQKIDRWIEYCKIQIGNTCVLCEDLAYLDQIQEICNLYFDSKKCIKNCRICYDQVCVECDTGYYGFQCIPQLGDGIVVEEEICYDLNNQKMNDNIECYSNCDINCISCINGICNLCLQGYYLFNNQCISNIITNIYYVNDNLDLCGDQIISINEECEDQNINPYDGCYQCKFQCDVNCINCQFGKCQDCLTGYILNTNYICEPECGDGILIPFTSEQCDNEDEECQNCQFKCQPYCIYCNLQQCLQCLNGFQINLNQCIPICGDGIVINNFEDCDDQNEVQFDGCFDCKFQCQQNCEICEQGKCLNLICPYGTIQLEDQCQSICGDKIIGGDEQCDDGNLIQYDGCYNCKYQCNQYCNICEEGICLQCIIDYDLINAICILQQQNDTDNIDQSQDSNTSFNPYGHNQLYSILDENMICRKFECTYSKKPKMKLTFESQHFSFQY